MAPGDSVYSRIDRNSVGSMLSSGAESSAGPHMQVSSVVQPVLHTGSPQVWTVRGFLARPLPHRAMPSMESGWP